MATRVGQFEYSPGMVGRTLDRWFPQRAQMNRQAALRNWMFDRNAEQFAASYDALDRSRLRKKRSSVTGSGDVHLTEQALSELREICRELCRNNPIVKGMLKIEANGVVGRSTKIEVRSSDEVFNTDAETLWRERVVEQPCEVTGRFGFHKALRTIFQSYRADGDIFVLLTDDGIQIAEGEQCGTPHGIKGGDTFDVTNGVATRKEADGPGRPAGQVIGYYIGRPDKWGFIRPNNFQRYTADQVAHVFNTDRFSYTRGEPALTSAVDWIDKLTRYADAALVAAHMQACFSIFIEKQSPLPGLPQPASAVALDTSDSGYSHTKIEPGMIWDANPGDKAYGLNATQPTPVFDSFILRCLSFIGRPLCFPLTYVSGDFSGATYMNMRFALDLTRDNFMQEQDEVLVPLLHRWHRWQMERWIASGELKNPPEDWYKRLIRCKRWRYIDLLKDAQADILLLENQLKSRRHIMGDRGDDFDEETDEMAEDNKVLKAKGLLAEKPQAEDAERGDEDGKDEGDGKDDE
ncbi:MAG: phage portal protein [Acidobacteriota bacterium]